MSAAALLAAAQDDPMLAHRLARAQQQALAELAALIDDAGALLARRLDAGAPPGQGGALDLLALRAGASRRVAQAARRRELVEAFVLGALINHDNPGWNPLDPATSRQAQDSTLALLLAAATDER